MHTQRPDYWRFWAPNAGSGPWHRNGRSENWRKCRLFIGFPMFASQSFSIIVSNLLFLEILWQRKRSYFVFCSTKLPFPKLTFRCLQQKRVQNEQVDSLRVLDSVVKYLLQTSYYFYLDIICPCSRYKECWSAGDPRLFTGTPHVWWEHGGLAGVVCVPRLPTQLQFTISHQLASVYSLHAGAVF